MTRFATFSNSNLLRLPTSHILSVIILFLFAAALPSFAQQSDYSDRRKDTSDPRMLSREPAPSDLTKDNLSRVAASPESIKELLAILPGVTVELKRWIAKEATDNGQLVEDSSLTDQAIQERIDRDVQFRAVATVLLQRYGYLLPKINPESDMAKQQDLVLKERARRLVQIEGQEDAQALAPRPEDKESKTSYDRDCDPRSDRDCDNYSPRRLRQRNPSQQDFPSNEPNSIPSPLPQFQSGQSQTLLAGMSRDDSSLQPVGQSDLVQSLTNEFMSGANSISPSQLSQDGSSLGSFSSLSALSSSLPRDDRSQLSSKLSSNNSALSDALRSGGYDKHNTRGGRYGDDYLSSMDRDVPSVAMVRKPNPYSDIPSLYDMYVQASPREKEQQRFGLKIFQSNTLEPDDLPMDLPVGPDYVVGPGDGLAINLWGGVSQRMFRIVDREGRIALPEAGPLLVSGRTMGDIQQTVQQLLRTQFRDISVDVSLSRLRTVRVYVVGEVEEPGAYDISSLSTPLNALFVAGGITPRGSLRSLQHYRGKDLIETVDAYDLLLHGVRGDMARLENGDTLMVPPVGPQVTVEGMVRRPAIYELRNEKSLEDAVELAGGILPAAALQHVEVQRIEAHQKRTMLSLDLSPGDDASTAATQLAAFHIQDGDQIHIFPIAPYNSDSIYLQGHVVRPGRYSFQDGMKLTDLLKSYSDLLPEPAAHYAEIVRLNAPDFRPSVESFDLASALADPSTAPKLQQLDTVRIFSRYDFEPAPTVWVGGDVRNPGKYRTSGQAHFRDAVFLAGGVSPDASMDSAQLFRILPDGTLKIFSVNLAGALSGNLTDNLLIQPRDRILIHHNLASLDPPTVYVKGEVAKPGRYPLTTNMHIEDLILVGGGLKRSADPVQADLTRYAEGDSTHTLTQSYPVELASVMDGNTDTNLLLKDGDVLTIRQTPGWNDVGASVTVKGEVQHPGSYGIRPGESLSSVLIRAGGFGPGAYPYGAVLTRQDVKDLEYKSHMDLVERLKAERLRLQELPEGNADQKNAKDNAIAQTDAALRQLQANLPIGRVVIHIRSDMHEWQNTNADVPMRNGDTLIIPKKADYVMVSGQVFNATAISFQPGRSARWYLSQSGGLTQVADKKAVFVIRADGSVISSKNNGAGWFSGDPLDETLRAGDSIVVPEKGPKVGGPSWTTVIQASQIATSVALAVAYIHP
jgi:protein involved in polysaccharide export with SLBB domain